MPRAMRGRPGVESTGDGEGELAVEEEDSGCPRRVCVSMSTEWRTRDPVTSSRQRGADSVLARVTIVDLPTVSGPTYI